MADLIAAGNTYNPSLLIMNNKGYKLWTEEDGDRLLWCASLKGREFIAYSPPELLGICCIWEEFGEAWNKQEPNLVARLEERLS